MITIRVDRHSTPAQQQPTAGLTAAEHREHAAWHLYEAVRPEGGLSWWQLTDAQRARYQGLITLAARCTDNTAVRAAHEGVSKLLAIHNDESLRDVPPEIRGEYRARGLSICLMFERILMTGSPATDANILTLVTEEADAFARRRGGQPS